MTLITSISGMRGTIGGPPAKGLTPLDTLGFVSAYASLLNVRFPESRRKVVIGRDARVSGEMVNFVVAGTLMGMGYEVIDLGLSTTPTVEMAVTHHAACAGIIITASHNPAEWNALKFLDEKGEFISAETGLSLLDKAATADFSYAPWDKLGSYVSDNEALGRHIAAILAHPLVRTDLIKQAGFHVVVDAVNSTGGIAVPALLEALGVARITELNCTPDGKFAHNPEPLPENLQVLSELVLAKKAHLGFAVDPDVDRLAIVSENGLMFGEEYTLVAVADYVLNHQKGAAVSNLSSTRALQDVCQKHGQAYYASAVGEVNVVARMKETEAVIGGEGNGGVILPDLHYGRDALAGIALFLSHLALEGKACSFLRDEYPSYHLSKNKITLSPGMDVNSILDSIKERYARQPLLDIDGVKIEFGKDWVHLRKSNTEDIIRIYSESDSPVKAEALAKKLINDIREVIKDTDNQ